MKPLVIILLLLALGFGLLGLRLSRIAAHQKWEEYTEDVSFVSKVKKDGFDQQAFQTFEHTVLRRAKGASLDSWPSQMCQQLSLFWLLLASEIVLFKWPRKDPSPTRPPETNARDVT